MQQDYFERHRRIRDQQADERRRRDQALEKKRIEEARIRERQAQEQEQGLRRAQREEEERQHAAAETAKRLAKEDRQRQEIIRQRNEEKEIKRKRPNGNTGWNIFKPAPTPLRALPKLPVNPRAGQSPVTIDKELSRKQFFGFVDRIQQRVPRSWYAVLTLLGGACGYVYGGQAGGQRSPIGYAFFGALAGLLFVPLLAFAVKLLMFALIIGFIVLVLYILMHIAK